MSECQFNVGDMVEHPDHAALHDERGPFEVVSCRMVKRNFAEDFWQVRAADPDDHQVFIVAPQGEFTKA